MADKGKIKSETVKVGFFDDVSDQSSLESKEPLKCLINRKYTSHATRQEICSSSSDTCGEQLTDIKSMSSKNKKSKVPHDNKVKEVNFNLSLFDSIKNLHSNSILIIIDEWIAKYKSNREDGLLELLQFFFSSSGCKGTLTKDMLTQIEQHDVIIRQMTQQFDEDSDDYPIIRSGPPWKKFKTNFIDFIQQLINKCQYSIIYDQYLIGNVTVVLTGLTDSQVRAFRHTATLAALKLTSSLVQVGIRVERSLEKIVQQYNSEKGKSGGSKASARIEVLKEKRQEMEENLEEIKGIITFIYKSVFVHRYRDILPDIRAVCISELTSWMITYPNLFLNDAYLKYIGWTLNDKVAEVRLKCIGGFRRLLESKELRGKLELFVKRFVDRIVAMTLDKDCNVGLEAVRLCTNILKFYPDELTDKHCEQIYELVFSSHRDLAQSTGEFLKEKLFSSREQTTALSTKMNPNRQHLKDLVQFIMESELHEHAAYFVDSLLGSNRSILTDWKCMTELLLDEESDLEGDQETWLMEIMGCSLRQAVTGQAPIGRGNQRKATMKQLALQHEEKQAVTHHFIQVILKLLDKYSADADKIINLISIPQYFDLSIYTTLRQENNLKLLFKKICYIIEKHTEDKVLEGCSKTMDFLCDKELIIYSICEAQKTAIIDSMIVFFLQSLDCWKKVVEREDIPEEDQKYTIVAHCKKVSIFYSDHNLNLMWYLWPKIIKELNNLINGALHLPIEAIVYCVRICYYALLWYFHDIESMVEEGAPVDGAVVELKKKLTSFLDIAQYILDGSKQFSIYQQEIYLTLCDLLLIFGRNLILKNQNLKQLIYEPNQTLIKLLNCFVLKNVFLSSNVNTDNEQSNDDIHTEVADLHKKRTFLASYCKLIVLNIVPMWYGTDILKHYVSKFNDYEDIIKTTLIKMKENNLKNTSRTILASLASTFKDLKKQKINYSGSEDFIKLKELAKRFALIFGWDLVRIRESMLIVHREGIKFALLSEGNLDLTHGPPTNTAFLEILLEFSCKLLIQDRETLLEYLNDRMATKFDYMKCEDWEPLSLYRHSLMDADLGKRLAPPTRSASKKTHN